MRLDKLAKAVAANETPQAGHAVVIYGPPKVGKTWLMATAAECEALDTLYWFDNENGYDALLTMVAEGLLSEEAAAKIVIVPIKDTRDDPYAIETMLKVLNSVRAPVFIDLSNGKVLPRRPAKVGEEHGVLEFQLSKLTSRDAVVVDSLSQLGDSALNGTCVGTDYTFKPLLDNYGLAGKWLTDCLVIIQQAQYCNFICATHEFILEEEGKAPRYYPMCGTTKMSPKVGKYFGTAVYMQKQGGKHKAGSGSTYATGKVTGSRRGILIEKQKELTLAPLFDPKRLEPKTEEAPPAKLGALARLKK